MSGRGRRARRRGGWPAVLAASALGALLLGGWVGAQEAGEQDPGEQAATPGELRAALARAAPSVVRVELLEGERLPEAVRWRLFRQVNDRAAGAGVVVGPRAILVHDVQACYRKARYRITTHEGELFAATIARRVPRLGVALLEADADLELTPIRWGRSTELAVGELVLSLSDPFGSARDGQLSATCGALEGRARLDARETAYAGEVLLTSAALNPGSEGGALLDLEGRLVGLLAPLSGDRRLEELGRGGSLLGYALPVELCRRALAGARRPELGFAARGQGQAVIVERVSAEGLAAAAGLQPGDRIVSVAGQAVRSTAELRLALERHDAEQALALVIEREGRRVELEVGP